MRVVTFKHIKDFSITYPDSYIALSDWYYKVSNKNWNNLVDIKKDFNSVDYVGNNRYVFDIKGNNYRMVCIIIFSSQKIYIRFIGTHKQYDKINAKNI